MRTSGQSCQRHTEEPYPKSNAGKIGITMGEVLFADGARKVLERSRSRNPRLDVERAERRSFTAAERCKSAVSHANSILLGRSSGFARTSLRKCRTMPKHCAPPGRAGISGRETVTKGRAFYNIG